MINFIKLRIVIYDDTNLNEKEITAVALFGVIYRVENR